MRRFLHWYGAGPLHLLTMLGSFALAGYAVAELLPVNFIGIPVWLVGAVIGHDLILMPLYTLADRSAAAVLRHRQPPLPGGPWINYLRVPVALSGLLLLIWFPLILRLPARFPATTTLSLDPYLWHWLAVTGGLFLLSALALAVRMRAARGRPPRRAGQGHPRPAVAGGGQDSGSARKQAETAPVLADPQPDDAPEQREPGPGAGSQPASPDGPQPEPPADQSPAG